MAKRNYGRESNCSFDHSKSEIALVYLREGGVPHIVGKIKEGYNFALDRTSIRGLQKNLWASKVTKAPILGILKLPT